VQRYGWAHLSVCALTNTFSLTPCFSWGLGDVLTRQPFQRLSSDGKPLKAVARLRPPSPTLLKQGVNERAVNTAVRQRRLLVQQLRCAAPIPLYTATGDGRMRGDERNQAVEVQLNLRLGGAMGHEASHYQMSGFRRELRATPGCARGISAHRSTDRWRHNRGTGVRVEPEAAISLRSMR
jgi:hypothetical protein